MNSESSELVLVKLMEMFNYSSVVITKKYLELRLEEILQTYESLSFWKSTNIIVFFGSAIPNTENKENVGYWIYN